MCYFVNIFENHSKDLDITINAAIMHTLNDVGTVGYLYAVISSLCKSQMQTSGVLLKKGTSDQAMHVSCWRRVCLAKPCLYLDI